MSRIVVSILLLLHGCLHFNGFAQEFGLFKVEQIMATPIFALSPVTAKTFAILWLAVGLLYIATAIFFFTKKNTWWQLAFISVLLSQLLIILNWPAAKWGTTLNIFVLAGAFISWKEQQFKLMVKNETKDLFKLEKWHNRNIITEEMIRNLPYPVYNWLAHCGIVGREDIFCVRLKQVGSMRLKPNSSKWITTCAEQYFTAHNPAFTWMAKMKFNSLLSVSGRDKFVNGQGNMLIKAVSCFTIANESGAKIDEGTMQRFLSEIVWFPSAALNKNIHWEPIDSLHAKATLEINNISASVIFGFNERAEVSECTADRYNGNKPGSLRQKWIVSIKETGIKNGIRIPLKVQVTWKLNSGDFTWYKLSITDIAYNFPYIY